MLDRQPLGISERRERLSEGHSRRTRRNAIGPGIHHRRVHGPRTRRTPPVGSRMMDCWLCAINLWLILVALILIFLQGASDRR